MGIAGTNLTGVEIRDRLMGFGISKLDAELIVDCINVRKSELWQNDWEFSADALAAANKYIGENGLGVLLKAEPSRFGKVIWEVKLLAKPAAADGRTV